MKQFIKKLFIKWGIWSPLRRLYKRLFANKGTLPGKYAQVHEWRLPADGIDLRFDLRDDYSKRWFLPRYDAGRIHEPVVTNLFMELIDKKDTVLDIGAHLGYFTCLAEILEKNGQVHAFEVDPKCMGLIEKNVEKNSLSNVFTNNMAVSDHVGSEKLVLKSNPNPSLRLLDVEGAVEVPAITIDAYLAERGITPHFVKVDVEGAEFKVLKGMEKTLRKNRFVMLIEIHIAELNTFFGVDYKEIISFLIDCGFQLKKINEHRSLESRFEPIGTHSELHGNTMLFCEKS